MSQQDKQLYIGYTRDINKRVAKHNSGRVVATKDRRPFDLIYYEAYCNEKDAVQRELYYKSGWGRRHINKTLEYTLKDYRA